MVRPKITIAVAIPTYNRPKFMVDAARSVLSQLLLPDELLLILRQFILNYFFTNFLTSFFFPDCKKFTR